MNNKKVFGKSRHKKNVGNGIKCTTCMYGFTQSNGGSSSDVKISCSKFAKEGMLSSPYKFREIVRVDNMFLGTEFEKEYVYDSEIRKKYTTIALDKAIRAKFNSSKPNWCIERA